MSEPQSKVDRETPGDKAPWVEPRLTLVGEVAQVLHSSGNMGKLGVSLVDPGEGQHKTKPSG